MAGTVYSYTSHDCNRINIRNQPFIYKQTLLSRSKQKCGRDREHQIKLLSGSASICVNLYCVFVSSVNVFIFRIWSIFVGFFHLSFLIIPTLDLCSLCLLIRYEREVGF